MKKDIFLLYSKLALSIVIFNFSSFCFANSDSKVETLIQSGNYKEIHNKTNHSILLFIESKSELTDVLFSSHQKTNINRFTGDKLILESNKKTRKLSHNFNCIIIPSLDTTKLIFPFHSFY